ncbi:MAG: UDP-N-acetylmuramate:L-alanyl-gamma-D-glutamyl-meso-diaminopimelate ligase [Pseudomonadota bacterium]
MHVHILGICGTFMGGVAALAREAGHVVTGSDAHIYPPMSDRLSALGIDVQSLNDPDQFDPVPDVVVVGNVMTRGMPAVEHVLNEKLPMTSGPQWLAENVLKDRRVIAVAGTHGKTTTSSLVAWLLDRAGIDTGFLIGGVPNNFGLTARLGRAPWFVVEADEYDSAFFDKRSKFVHYGPEVAVLNNLEFDHADIFADLAAIETQFHHLVRVVPGNGSLVVNARDANLARVLGRGAWTKVVPFGVPDRGWSGEWHEDDTLSVHCDGQRVSRTLWALPGAHNADNAAAACAAVVAAGVSPARLAAGLSSFTGVRRRAEVVKPSGSVTVIDDFAHHPTAVRGTLEGLRRRAPSRLVAVVELRSNTMKSGVHAEQLEQALDVADAVFLSAAREVDQAHYRYPLARDVDALLEDVCRFARAGDTIAVMSNGGFANFSRRLAAHLAESLPA